MKYDENMGLEQNGKRNSGSSSYDIKGPKIHDKSHEQKFIANLPSGHLGKADGKMKEY